MKFFVKARPIKGGKNTLGTDRRGRTHWRKPADGPPSSLAPSTPGHDPEKSADRKFKRNLNKMKVSYGPGSPGHPEAPKKTLDTYRAVALAEGFEEGSEEEVIEAWQHLIDTGLAWKLQGSFGCTAESLISQGVCHRKK